MIKNALIAGASGLVGSSLVSQLIKSDYYNSIHIISRRTFFFEHPKLHSYTIDFENLHTFKSEALIKDVYVCLGTTLKKAGSIENFRKVDIQYVIELAKWAKMNGVERFSVISSVGADRQKRNYYLKAKGEMEKELETIGFDHLVILRPSLLLGKRNESRFAEQIGIVLMKVFSPMLIGKLKKYKAVKASDVAGKMFISTINSIEAVTIVENDEIYNT